MQQLKGWQSSMAWRFCDEVLLRCIKQQLQLGHSKEIGDDSNAILGPLLLIVNCRLRYWEVFMSTMQRSRTLVARRENYRSKILENTRTPCHKQKGRRPLCKGLHLGLNLGQPERAQLDNSPLLQKCDHAMDVLSTSWSNSQQHKHQAHIVYSKGMAILQYL